MKTQIQEMGAREIEVRHAWWNVLPFWLRRLVLLFVGVSAATHALLEGSYLAWVVLAGVDFSRLALATWFSVSVAASVFFTAVASLFLAGWPHHFFEEEYQ